MKVHLMKMNEVQLLMKKFAQQITLKVDGVLPNIPIHFILIILGENI